MSFEDRAAVLDAETAARADDQSWVDTWSAQGPTKGDVLGEVAAWVRGRPESVAALMRRFPPSCLVRATRPLRCPRPGTVGIVASYNEAGLIGVRQHPDADMNHHCEPNWLEPVGYYGALTPRWVASVLDAGREA